MPPKPANYPDFPGIHNLEDATTFDTGIHTSLTGERSMHADDLPDTTVSRPPTRRLVLGALAGLGVGTATFRRALAADAARVGKVTPEMVQQAEWVAGIKLSDEDRKATANALTQTVGDLEKLRE